MIVTPTLKYSLAKGILESRIMLTRAGIGANPDNGRRSLNAPDAAGFGAPKNSGLDDRAITRRGILTGGATAAMTEYATLPVGRPPSGNIFWNQPIAGRQPPHASARAYYISLLELYMLI